MTKNISRLERHTPSQQLFCSCTCLICIKFTTIFIILPFSCSYSFGPNDGLSAHNIIPTQGNIFTTSLKFYSARRIMISPKPSLCATLISRLAHKPVNNHKWIVSIFVNLVWSGTHYCSETIVSLFGCLWLFTQQSNNVFYLIKCYLLAKTINRNASKVVWVYTWHTSV